MPKTILVADAGSTKTEWCLLRNDKVKSAYTPGISPYFLNSEQIADLLKNDLLPALKKVEIDGVYFYGTGCLNPANIKMVKNALKKTFPTASVYVTNDVEGAAIGLCGKTKGIACILGTGSSSCFFDGRRMKKSSPGLGYALGDEGSGAYLGKKVLQYYLYNTFDEDLRARFDAAYITNAAEILENVYKKPLPNRYLASFSRFLAENRGHYMIENIIEDGLNDFFFTHLVKYNETWKYPVNFVGGVAYAFKDVIRELCAAYNFELGRILQKPMKGLIEYYKNESR